MAAFFLVGFLLAAGVAAGNVVLRFFAGIAAILGCLGLVVVILALLLIYRLMNNPISNLALLVGTGTWAWWYTVRRRQEKSEAKAKAAVVSYEAQLGRLDEEATRLRLRAARVHREVQTMRRHTAVRRRRS